MQILDFFIAMVNGGLVNATRERPLGLSVKPESVFAETLPEDVFGSVSWDGPPVSLEDMEAGILQEAKRRDEGA